MGKKVLGGRGEGRWKRGAGSVILRVTGVELRFWC